MNMGLLVGALSTLIEKHQKWPIVLAVLLILLIGGMRSDAQAKGILIWPTNIVLEDGKNVGQVLIANSGDKATLVRISPQKMKMDITGALHKVGDAEHHKCFAEPDTIRLAPRQFILAANTQQTVRVIGRRPDHQPTDETRIHVSIAYYPVLSDLPGNDENAGGTKKQITIQMVGITEQIIPVFVRRVRSTTAKVYIDKARLLQNQDGSSAMAVKIMKEGAYTVRGDMKVFYIANGGKTEIQVGKMIKEPIYCEIDSRLMQVPLTAEALKAAGFEPGQGHFRISFDEIRENGPRASTTFVLPIGK